MKNLNNYICPLCREVIVNEKPNYELIELNKKRLIPQKELENYLKNLKYSKKIVYQKSIESYL